MSHGDYLSKIPKNFKITSRSNNKIISSIEDHINKIYGLQFHPEVFHTQKGKKLIQNYLDGIFESNNNLLKLKDCCELKLNIQNELLDALNKTKNNSGLNLNLALSYGSRQEIISTTKNIVNKVISKEITLYNINEELFSKLLQTKNLKDPDLLIRTGGNFRLSNFLLWQIAYTEIYITNEYWPEFSEENLIKAIYEFQKSERRFGKISEQININN